MRILFGLIVATTIFTSSLAAQSPVVQNHDGPAAWTRFGTALACVGDVDDDGWPDIAVGAPHDDVGVTNSGSVWVYSGLDGTVLHLIHGGSLHARFGWSIDGLGDLNGDGHDDFIVGAPAGATPSGLFVGFVQVISGADGSLLHMLYGANEGDNFGVSVSAAGDVDGDGVPDFIVGANGTDLNGDHSGSAQVHSGATGLLLHAFHGDSGGDEFGRAVTDAGDVNGDGHADLIVGAHCDDDNGPDCGSVRVFSGLDGSILWQVMGDGAGDFFGYTLDGLGDVNDDGFDDVVVGAHLADANGIDSGCARVYSGQDGSVIHSFIGAGAGDEFGISVRSARDVNGDDVQDIVVGAHLATGGIASGTATVFDGVDGSLIQMFGGDWWADQFGYAVAGVGDLSGDGFGDILVGAPDHDTAGLAAGQAKVLAMPTMPILKFRSGLPTPHRLDADWLPDGGDRYSLTATITCEHATPFATGAYGASLTRIDYALPGGVPLMIADDNTNLVEAGIVIFDAAGSFTSPNVSRSLPSAVGELVHVQFFELWPVLSSSPGIRLELAP